MPFGEVFSKNFLIKLKKSLDKAHFPCYTYCVLFKYTFWGGESVRITQEADYALRIVCLLAKNDSTMDANTIAADCCITQRFALKILRKLVLGKLVCSFKGASGGYRLGVPPSEITMKDVIELIDGEIAISRCLADDHICSRSGDNKGACVVHCIFDAINRDVVKKLEKVTIASLVDPNVSAEDMIQQF